MRKFFCFYPKLYCPENMKILSSISLATLALVAFVPAFADVPVIPRVGKETPSIDFEKAIAGTRVFTASPRAKISAPKELANEEKYLRTVLKRLTRKASRSARGEIRLSVNPKLEKEGYKLKVETGRISIEGGDAAGVFYGIQTLNQLLFAAGKKGKPGAVPCVTIEDAPICSWRGALVDSARHFKSKEWMMKFIDIMAVHKLNRLHWHIVDAEAWRLEIKKYPKLATIVKDSPPEYPSEDPENKSRPARFMYGWFHGGNDGSTYYYTQEDVKEVVAYAKSRHIEIMPEIEFPGHSMAAITAYPEFGTTGKIPTVRSNHSPDLYIPNEKGIGFLKDVLDETMDLFPFEMIHFGGDEAPKGQWKASPVAQAKIKELGLDKHGDKAEDALQAWMFNELAAHIAKRGKRPAGWEEITHGNNMEHLTKTAVVMPWLSLAQGVKVANAGYGIIHTSTFPFYFDSWQTDSPADNWALYKGPFRLEHVYNFNLFPGGLSETGRKNILGAQAQLWSEVMTKPRHVEYQAFPRLAALAELTWTPAERKDFGNFYKRLIDHGKLLDAYKINYRYIDPLPAGTWNAETLADKSFELKIPEDALKKVDGKIVVDFKHTKGGAKIELRKVELYRNGQLVSTDEHDGFAGREGNENNFYRLPLERVEKGKYSLKIYHATENRDTAGEIRIYADARGTALFDPRNFAGGDYPSATWNKGETQSGKLNLRIPMDGLIESPGAYELVFSIKDPAAPVALLNPHVVGAAGEGVKFNARGKITAESKTCVIPIVVKKKDITRGNSVVVSVDSSKPSAGEVRVRKTKALPSKNGKFLWTPEILGEGRIVAYAQKIAVKKAGTLKVTFRYTGGGNGADITSVQVIDADGSIIAENSQKGFAGGNSKNNVYLLESPNLKAGKIYNLRIAIAGAGGTDSNGEIAVE